MKAPYAFLLLVTGMLMMAPLRAEEAKKVDVFALKAIPDATYSLKLELKQLDGKAVTLEVQSQNGVIEGTDATGRLDKVQGRSHFIGNGVFMVILRGKGYVATQYWCFQPDGTAQIKEIPDRGEKQTATVVQTKPSN